MNKTRNFLSLLMAGIIFGSFGIWIRLLGKDLAAYQQIFVRNLLGFIFALAVIFILKQRLNLKEVNKAHLFFYAISFPLAQVFYTLAMLNTKMGVTTFVFYAASFVFSFIIGKIFFSDDVNVIKVSGLLLAFTGIFILSYNYFSSGLMGLGLIFGFLSGIFDAATNAFRRFLAGKVERFVLVAIQMAGGVIVATLFLTFFRQGLPTTVSPETIVIAIFFGLLLVPLNFLLNFGFQNFDLNLGTILLSIELVAASVFGLLVFGENPSQTDILGGLFIIAAILVSNAPNFLKSKMRYE